MDGYYAQGSGYFKLWVNAVKGVGAQLAETLANRLNRRAMFVEAATADVSQTGYTHRMQDNQEWLTFVKPYTSYDKFDLSAGGTVKGHTTGILLGISNMYRNEHLFTLYLGYETTDDSADSLDFDMNTVYGGAKFPASSARQGTRRTTAKPRPCWLILLQTSPAASADNNSRDLPTRFPMAVPCISA